MKLTEIFLNEGERDEYYRGLAARSAEQLTRYLSSRPRPKYVGDSHGTMTSAFVGRDVKVPEQLKYIFDKLIIFFDAVPPGGKTGALYTPFPDDKKIDGAITLYITTKDAGRMDEKTWSQITKDEAYQWVTKHRDHLVHEFTHRIDSLRYEDPKYSSAKLYDVDKVRKRDPEELKKYFNTPAEYNAYLQEEIDKLDQALQQQGVRSMNDVKRLLHVSDANSFVRKFLKSIYWEFRNNMTTETRRRVTKRALQYWNDLEQRLSG